MAIFYVTYQDNKKNGTKLFYGKAIHPGTIGLDKLAERVQRNCSMKKSDCLAVITELIEVMNDELQNSNKVCLDGLGTFYINMQSSGAISEEDYNINQNVKGVRVRFLPTGRRNVTNGKMTRTFTDGIQFKKAEF